MTTNRSLLALLVAGAAISLPLHAQTAAPAGTPAAAPATETAPPGSSWDYTTQAWNAKTAGNDANVVSITTTCINQYGAQAIAQQKSLTAPVPSTDKAAVQAMWALNDVGVCYFLRGQSYEKLGKTKEATDDYNFLANNLPFSQCWDPKGWFWKPAGAAAERVKALQFDAIK